MKREIIVYSFKAMFFLFTDELCSELNVDATDAQMIFVHTWMNDTDGLLVPSF